ncbi:MAG: NAD(P)/FAD-dependent oxidoreductase [Rhizobium sp.]|nr:NAD(P)/FAD-dependent oxidoreductase [Rhizobium sp.]MBX9459173.1 NAD(P)/FAD-dependent oxidoreductase [Rhizobium sp.]
MTTHDYIVVGSGINALVAAALLGKKGKKVLVLERNDRIGGCLRTEEITEPGFRHDVMATTMVLFLTSPAYGALGKDLEARGLEFAHADLPTGVLMPDGRHAILSKDRQRNVAAFEALASGDGQAFARDMDRLGADAPFLFSLLGGSLWSGSIFKTVLMEAWKRGPRGLAAWFGDALVSGRAHLETTYRSEEMQALFAPWVLHCGLGPESAYSGAMLKVIGFAIELAGCPVVKGGADNLLKAFERLITDNGGTIRTGADVDQILGGVGDRATGVRLAGGEVLTASQGVIASVTPTQLYDRLLKGYVKSPTADVSEGLRTYRYGKGNMQIHYALKSPPRWKAGADLGKVALLHLTPGLDGVSRASNECERGLLPAVPTICVGQPTAFDPSRAPEGKSILWLQLPEAPRLIKGDAAAELPIPADGRWTEELRERYADRVERILESHIDGWSENVIARKTYSPADLETMNMNLVGGDPYGGFCGVDQFFVWRPFKSSVNHRTHVPGLYHIGASTHPGPGLGGGSGFLLASALK